jgi:hypothetical protein
MPFGEGQQIPHEELSRLRGMIEPDRGEYAEIKAKVEGLAEQLAQLKLASPVRDRSELLDLLAASPEAKAIRKGF